MGITLTNFINKLQQSHKFYSVRTNTIKITQESLEIYYSLILYCRIVFSIEFHSWNKIRFWDNWFRNVAIVSQQFSTFAAFETRVQCVPRNPISLATLQLNSNYLIAITRQKKVNYIFKYFVRTGRSRTHWAINKLQTLRWRILINDTGMVLVPMAFIWSVLADEGQASISRVVVLKNKI